MRRHTPRAPQACRAATGEQRQIEGQDRNGRHEATARAAQMKRQSNEQHCCCSRRGPRDTAEAAPLPQGNDGG